ncbi:hypothetical protein ACLOJK_014630 [Asimina triloba]
MMDCRSTSFDAPSSIWLLAYPSLANVRSTRPKARRHRADSIFMVVIRRRPPPHRSSNSRKYGQYIFPKSGNASSSPAMAVIGSARLPSSSVWQQMQISLATIGHNSKIDKQIDGHHRPATLMFDGNICKSESFIFDTTFTQQGSDRKPNSGMLSPICSRHPRAAGKIKQSMANPNRSQQILDPSISEVGHTILEASDPQDSFSIRIPATANVGNPKNLKAREATRHLINSDPAVHLTENLADRHHA